MGLAPLDAWARMLARGGAWKRVHPRYWVRLAWCLFTSALGTVLTLPERIILAAVLRARGRPAPTDSPDESGDPTSGDVAALCILGYYRSGTTHLHYMLSCDPALATPRWAQVLAPQGWVVSWLFLRWFLVPFLGSTRPQDDVAIGPEWPAEDDFAHCNWTLSSTLPGRMVLPREWDASWKQLHDLHDATERDRRRWRRAVTAFAWKISRAERGDKRVILKTPSHTARVQLLVDAFGAGRVKFIHLVRDPAAVLRSNVSMHARFGPYLLQDPVGDAELRRRIIEEYSLTERRLLEQADSVPRGDLARIRYQDLIADPVGELRRAYAELGLEWSGQFERRLASYLADVADYRAASGSSSKRATEPTPPELEWMHTAFGHDRPTIKPVQHPSAAPATMGRPVRAQIVIDTLIITLLVATAWIGIAWALRDRLDWMTWPAGVAIGIAAVRAAGAGSMRLGFWAAVLTATALAIVAYPATCLAFYRSREPMPWWDVWDSTRDGLLAVNNLIWLFLGIMTAYRLASRKQTTPPGGSGAR